MGKPFRFKQFEIRQEAAAMKVSTDGILLGAWAALETGTSILDIGTGTGLLALMSAQRNPNAQIIALDLDEAAAAEASENVAQSPWAARMAVHQADIRTYQAPHLFDHIICNPPYYPLTPLSQPTTRKVAREAAAMTFTDLARAAATCLQPTGSFHLIIPAAEYARLANAAEQHGLYLHHRTQVRPVVDKAVHRLLLRYGKQALSPTADELVLMQADRQQRTPAYQELVDAFYL